MISSSQITKYTTLKELFIPHPFLEKALLTLFYFENIPTYVYFPENTLEEVAKKNNLKDPSLLVSWMKRVKEFTPQIEVSPQDVILFQKYMPTLLFVDVRTKEERALASIPGSIPYEDALQDLDKDSPIVFYCHHGVRSLHKAWYFFYLGFTQVHSLKGGIDFWSTSMDPSIPLY